MSESEPIVERGWQPIETAPHDGTEIVAWTASGAAWIVSWEGSGWRIKKPPGRDPILYVDAVRWMPLPEPPRTAPQKKIPWEAVSGMKAVADFSVPRGCILVHPDDFAAWKKIS